MCGFRFRDLCCRFGILVYKLRICQSLGLWSALAAQQDRQAALMTPQDFTKRLYCVVTLADMLRGKSYGLGQGVGHE